jgi:hypothetical protein
MTVSEITITNRNTKEEITLHGLSRYEVQVLADLVTPVNADWKYFSDGAVPPTNKAVRTRGN